MYNVIDKKAKLISKNNFLWIISIKMEKEIILKVNDIHTIKIEVMYQWKMK